MLTVHLHNQAVACLEMQLLHYGGGQRQLVTPSEMQTRDEIAHVAKSPAANVEVSFRSASLANVKVEKLPISAKL